MAVIALEGMKFYAYHGFYEEERIIGGEYEVNVQISTNISKAAVNDDLAGTINYETVFLIVEAEMRKPSQLLEQVVARIILGLKFQFKKMAEVQVEVKKLNPPLDGQVAFSSLTDTGAFAQKCGRCQNPLICYSDKTCQCMEHGTIYSKTRESMREKYGNKCLCKDCLDFYMG